MLSSLPLAPEEPVIIRVDEVDVAVLFCTPLALDELAIGHIAAQGLLPGGREDLVSVFVCPDRGRVDIRRAPGLPPPSPAARVIASGCGSGAAPGELFGLGESASPRVSPRRLFSPNDLRTGTRAMFATAELHRETGGMHCAALLDPAGGLVVREDVGRHNAVDKVLGRAILDARTLEDVALLSSGRLAADMIAKALYTGVAVVVSRSIPTTAAFELARSRGMTLVGRVLSPEPLIYCGRERLGL